MECRYLISLFKDISNRFSRIILYGKLSQHSKNCTNPNCEMHRDNIANSILDLNEFQNAEKHNVAFDLLKSFCRRRFLYAKTLHGDSVSLCLDCCLFFVEEIKNPILALSELKTIESFHLTFYEEFLLHRYTKLVKQFCDSQISEARELERQQLRSINLQSSVKKFEELLKNVTNKYIGFWCALEEETPKYSFLEKTLIVLYEMYREMEYTFEQLREAQSYRTLKLYGYFLLYIMKEEKLGAKLLKDAEELSHIRNTNEDLLGGVSMAELKHITNETPVIIVSGNEKRLGIILDCNSALMRLFGYTKEELISSNISMLIPEPFTSIHEKLMISRKNDDGSSVERQIFGLHRNRYIFQGILRIVRHANILNSFTYIAIINQTFAFTNSPRSSLLLSRDLRILALNSQCLAMLELSYFQIRQHEVNLRTVCPELKSLPLKEFLNNWRDIEYFFPLKKQHEDIRSEEDDDLDNIDTNEILVDANRTSVFSFRIESIVAGPQCIGYWASFCQIKDSASVEEKKISTVSVRPPPDFRFRFDPAFNSFIRDTRDCWGSDTGKASYHSIATGSLNTFYDFEKVFGDSDSTTRKKAVSGFYYLQKRRIENLFRGRDRRIKADLSDLLEYVNEQIHKKPDYSLGIKTCRLLNGDQIEISNQANQQSGMIDDDFTNIGGKSSRSGSKKSQRVSNLLSSIKSKKFLMRIIREISMPLIIKIVLLISLIIIALNIGLSIFLTKKFSDNYETVDNNNLLSFYTLQKNTVIVICYLHLHELFLINSGVFTNSLQYYKKSTAVYRSYIIAKLTSEAVMISYYLNLLVTLLGKVNNGDEITNGVHSLYLSSYWPSEINPKRST